MKYFTASLVTENQGLGRPVVMYDFIIVDLRFETIDLLSKYW